MAILRLVVVLLLATSILPGCGSLPEATQTSAPREGIAWIERQFKTCSGKDCPTPTRKTLALVELPIAKKASTPPIAEPPPKVAPVIRHEEPVTATVLFEFGKSVPSTEGQRALQRLAAIVADFRRIEIDGRTDDIGSHACDIAGRRANMSLYAPDKAMVNGIAAPWMPGDLPTRDWGAIRATYWGIDEKSGAAQFQLGRFDRLARFFASSRAAQHFPPAAPIADPAVTGVPIPTDAVVALPVAAPADGAA